MKFLCPSCKAKYQIGDDKVAGRSVRMKCRKCGYVIQVSSVPGLGDALPGSEPPPAPIDALSDVSAAPPPAALPFAFEPGAGAGATPRPASAAVPKSAPSASSTPTPASARSPASASAATPASSGQRPEVKKIPVTGARPAAPKPVFAPSAPSAPKAPAAGAPNKPPPAKSSPQKPAPTPASAPLGIKSDKRTIQGAAPAPATAALPAVAPKPTAIVDKPLPPVNAFPEVEEEERTRIADVGALAGAFSLAVGGASDAASADSLSMPADEWFVGINGVPVGPIRLSELRSKAASGSVNRDSLVWRDGFEDWRPLGTFPELSAIVDESVSSARAALTPFTPAVAMAVGAVPSATDAVVVPAASSPEVEAYAGSGNGVTAAAVVTDELVAAGVPKRSGTSPAAWIAVAIALMFGLTIGFVLFNKGSKTVEVVKYVDRVVPGATSVVAAPDTSVAIADPNTPADPKTIKHAPTPVKSGGSAPAEPDKTSKGLPGLAGLSPTGAGRGPDVPVGPSGTVSGTGQLDSGQIQSTVARYTGSVKRACWQPALDTRDRDAPTTARVNVAITVLPSGSVSNAAVNGDPKGYRGLSQCISSRVRGWQFPPSGDTTTVNVPFVFAAQ